MIRFKCIYCGQRILAQEQGRGKKGHCPKCGHELRVPITTKGRPAISPDKEPMPDRSKPRVPEWDKDLRSFPGEPADELIDLYKESFSFFVPTYDDLSVFLMVVTLVALYLTNIGWQNRIGAILAKCAKENMLLLLIPVILVLLGAMGLCVFQVFTSREKTVFEKRVMVGFAVLVNLVTGVVVTKYMLTNAVAPNWMVVFPIWNVINGTLMIFLVSLRVIDEDCISDRKATPIQIVLGLTAVLVIFIFCNYVFKLHWVITFSICIVYTTSFDKALQSVFPGLEVQGE